MRRSRRVKVSADGTGLVSRAGVALLRELTEQTGLAAGWTAALLDTYRAVPRHAPGRMLADLAVTIADGGDAFAIWRRRGAEHQDTCPRCGTRVACGGLRRPS